MKKVSIVLPTFNGERYLKESIESILRQSYQNWELIIVDDCSTDSTPEIAKSFSSMDSRILYVRNERNKKLPASLNVGFSFAKGDYYTWTSDDNYFADDALEIMVNELDSNPDVGVVYCDINCINENGDLLSLPKIATRSSFIYIINVVRACFMYRAEVDKKLKGYNESMFLVEDYDFWIRAYRYFNFSYLKCAPYFYRFHSGSLTRTKEASIRAKTREMLKRELRFSTRWTAKLGIAIGLLVNSVRAALIGKIKIGD